jgi:DNA-damage-inducible protein J
MSKSTMVRVKIESELKEHAEEIFNEFGLNSTQAITMFYKHVEVRKDLPFDVEIPKKQTVKTFKATDTGKDLVICEDAQDMFKKLGI